MAWALQASSFRLKKQSVSIECQNYPSSANKMKSLSREIQDFNVPCEIVPKIYYRD